MSNKSISFPSIVVTILSIAGLLVSALSYSQIVGAASTIDAGERLITIHDRETEKSLISEHDTLREIFDEADITVDPNDIVEPGLDETLVGNNYQVNVYRARPVVIVDGANHIRVMSAHQTPKQIAKHAGIDLHDEDEAEMSMTNNLMTNGLGIRMTIDRATPVKLVLYGEKETVYTQATTVDEFLDEKDITLAKKDTLSVKRGASVAANMKIEIWRNGKQTVTVDEAIAFPVEKIQDADREVGYRDVKTPGIKGKKTVTYQIVMKNGKEVKRKIIQSVTIKQPKKQIEIIGAKFNYTGGPLSETQINALGQCETGMNPTTNTGNGYYGAFQFSPGTWSSTHQGPYTSAHQAPLAVQKQAVQDLLSRSSIYSQFPGCARQMDAQGIL